MKLKNSIDRRCSVVALASASALSFLHVSVALSSSAPTEVDEGRLEVVTVAARRVAEDLQTTGASVTAFTGEELAARNVTELTDLTRYTPNLELKANAGSAADGLVVKIRGIGVSNVDFLNADPSVAVYVDGVFQARAFGPQAALFDLESVEVLRGRGRGQALMLELDDETSDVRPFSGVAPPAALAQ